MFIINIKSLNLKDNKYFNKKQSNYNKEDKDNNEI